MRRIALVVAGILFVFVASFVTSAPVAAQTSTRPNMFPTMAACKAALKSGNLRFYEPKYFGLKKKNPTNGVDRVPVTLESDMCLKMFVVGGRRFVAQREGTVFRAQKLADGSLSLYARDDCGNPVYGVVFPAPAPPALPPAPPPSALPPVTTSPPVAPSQPQPVVTVVPVLSVSKDEKSHLLGWGITGGGTLGTFSSTPVRGIISSIAGRNACSVEGRTFDIGLAIGGPDQSFWRITFMGMLVRDGSSTTYDCKDCGMQVTAVSKDMKVWGGNVERIFMLGSKDWKVQPMISLHAGVGQVSGQAYRYIGPIGGSATSVQQVGADQLFGSKFFALAGGGIGFMGNLGDQLTYTVAVAGIEYPGVYYGRAQLTYWPRQVKRLPQLRE